MKTRVISAFLVGAALIPSLASAQWATTGSGSAISKASTVNPGNPPSANVTGATVALSWQASTLATGDPVTGYIVKRYDSSGSLQQTIASGSCSVQVSGTSCSQTSTPEGTWRYSVTPVHNNWSGAESSKTSVTVDLTAPPVPTITASPPTSSTSGTANFSFSDTESGVTFECQIDAGSFTACTSPKTYSNLANGSHTFSVRALDAAGNASATASHTWTVQSCSAVTVSSFAFTPQNVTIAAGCSVTWTNVSSTSHNSTSNTGVWSSGTLNQNQSFTYQFQTPGTYGYRCTIHPSSMTGTITVNALTGDTTPPTTTITFPAAGSSFKDAAGWDAGCGTGAGDVCGTASDNGGSGVNKVQVSFQQGNGNYWNGSGFSSPTEVLFNATGTTSWSYPALASNVTTEGPYTVRARAIDNENNVSTVASSTYTVDFTAPPTPTITSSPPSSSASPSASFSFTDTESGVTFECRIDFGSFTVCTSPKTYSNLVNGSHTFRVRALDAAGNVSSERTYTWTVQSCSQVTVSSFAFTPQNVTIGAGCSVTWTTNTFTDHNSTSNTGVWSSGTLADAGDSFTFQFTTPGTYPYRCTIHPTQMTGTITVN